MPDEKHQLEKQLDWDKVKGFAFQTMIDIGTAMHGALSFIGDRLGIFKALAGAGWVTQRGARGAHRVLASATCASGSARWRLRAMSSTTRRRASS